MNAKSGAVSYTHLVTKTVSVLLCGQWEMRVLMAATLKKHWNGQRILIQTVSHNMRVHDTVIMMKHMITAIWMCTAGCTPVSYTHLDVYKRQLQQSM